MNQEKYFAEITRHFDEQAIQYIQSTERNSVLAVISCGKPVCHMDKHGNVFHIEGDLGTRRANNVHSQVVLISQTIREYMTSMEIAPPLKAVGLDDGYKLLCEFNGTVLAGEEIENDGYQFITWERSHDGTAVINGNYFHNEYESAKRDFVSRANLIDHNKLLTDEQLIFVNNAVAYCLGENRELSDYSVKALSAIYEQLGQVLERTHHNTEQSQRMDMQMNI